MRRIEPKIAEFKRLYPDHFQTYQAENRKMSFAWSGDVNKTPLIFIHGSPGSWEAWAEFLLDQNLQKRFHVIAIDRPGYGGSSVGITEPSLARQAADIFKLLQFNKSGQRAILVGHSYGGPVIAQLAMDYPEQIAGLVFVASSVDPMLERVKWYQRPAAWWPIRSIIPTALRVCNEEILALKVELEKQVGRWTEIKVRVATIQGEADDLVPALNQDFILKKSAPTQVVFVKRMTDMNHFVPWEHPELIFAGIEAVEEK